MTVATDLKEFLAAYLVEAEEHVTVANARLLALEAAQRAGANDPKALRDLFRSLHTIKGLSSMVGVDAVVTIAHRMEAFVRELDRSGAAPPPRATDVLLRGVQAISQRIGALGQGESAQPPSRKLLAELDALAGQDAGMSLRSAATLDLEPALLEKLAPFEIEQLARGIAAGRRGVLGHFQPSPERAAQGFSINSVRERLSSLAELVRVLPRSVPVSPEAPGGLAFALLLLTNAPDTVVAEMMGVEVDSLSTIHDRAGPEPLPGNGLDEVPGGDEARHDALTPGARKGIVRVDVNRLDEAMEGLSTLIVTRFRLARAVAALAAQGVNTRELSDVVAENARQLRDLRAAIVRVRMVPVADLLDRIPLLVRGLQRTTNRRVRLELEGGSAELDKSVSERLFPVLVHLVRNAVDHAIETPDERLRRGKPQEGALKIVCSARANSRLEVSVSDDGRGIDRHAVARRAGRPVPETEPELLELLCVPGLSTREVATTTSGRGMGMEIVKRVVVEELGGELELDTRVGSGTTFTLRVPLTISIVDAFSFECSGQRFVVPVATVEEIVELDRTGVVQVPANDAGGPEVEVILRRGQAVPVIELSRLFGMAQSSAESRKAIVVRRAGAPLAFAVDRMLGQQEVVIRPMSDALVRAPGVSGATDLGDGKPTLVLDLVALGTTLSAPSPARGSVA